MFNMFTIRRSAIKLKRYFSSIKEKDDKGMSMIEKKAYILFKQNLLDSNADTFCSIKTSKRHIRNNNILLMLNVGQDNYFLTVIDESDNIKHNIYEVMISVYYGKKLSDAFDIQMERKLRGSEFEKKNAIINDLDTLLKRK